MLLIGVISLTVMGKAQALKLYIVLTFSFKNRKVRTIEAKQTKPRNILSI